VGIIAVAAALLAWLPGQAEAQDVGAAVDGWGGIAIPAADLGEFQDFGPSFGLGFEYLVTDRLFLRASGGADLHSGSDAGDLDGPPGGLDAPDVTLVHFGGGVGVRLTPPDETNWDISASLEAGGTSVTTDDFPAGATPPEGATDFSETYFSLSPGLRIGYLFGGRYNLFFRSQPRFALADAEDTAVFAQFDSNLDSGGFDSIWNLPLTAGLQVRF
jgi:hypothetical protein